VQLEQQDQQVELVLQDLKVIKETQALLVPLVLRVFLV
jgi:hypothetical protein